MILKFHLLLISIMCLFSCQIEFDKQRWATVEDPVFPPSARSSMLQDLLENHQLIGLTCSQLETKLGPADYKDSSSILYKIEVDYESIDPVYSKDLEFAYSKDSTIRKFNVVEWKSQ